MQLRNGCECIQKSVYRILDGDSGGGFIILHTDTHAQNTHYTSALNPDAHKIIILVENKQKKTHTYTYTYVL